MAQNFEDFEDINFDDFGDLGEGGFHDQRPLNPRSRNPAMIVGGAAVTGLKDGILDPRNQVKFLKGVLPEGYGYAIDTVDQTVTGIKEIYDTGVDEAKKVQKIVKRGVRTVLPTAKNFLPKGITDTLTEWSKDNEFKAGRREDPEQAEIAMATASIFAKYQEDQRQREQERDVKEDIRDTMSRKQFGSNVAALVAINNNLGRLVSYQDQVAANFQQKSLELQYRHYFVSRKLLDVQQQALAQDKVAYEKIAFNTNLPDMVKQRNTEKALDILKTNTFGRATDSASQWFRGIGSRIITRSKDNIRSFFQDLGASASNALMMGEMAQGMTDMVRDTGMGPNGARDLALDIGGGQAGSMAAQWLMNKLMAPVRQRIQNNAAMGGTSNMLLRMGTDMPTLINEWAGQGSNRMGVLGRFEDFIKSAVGTSRRSDHIMGSSTQDLEKNALWNVKSQRTLNEIIPGWMSKMHQELKMIRTGKKPNEIEREYYNFETNRFESEKEMKRSVTESVYNKYDMESLNRRIEETLNALDPEVKLSDGARQALRKHIFKLAADRKPFKMVELVDENIFPRALRSFKAEIMPLAQQRFGFDPNAAVDNMGNYMNPFGPFEVRGDGQKHLLEFSRKFALLGNNLPNALESAIAQAKLGNQELLERTGVATRDGGNYKLNMDALLERALGAAPPTPRPAPTPHATGGLHIDNTGGNRKRRGYNNLVRNGLIQGEGTGESDSINMGSAQVSNREYIVNARSTGLPGVLPLLRYINRLGLQGGNGVDITGSQEAGLDGESVVEAAINRFHDDWKTAADKTNDILQQLLEAGQVGLRFNLGGGRASGTGGSRSLRMPKVKLPNWLSRLRGRPDQGDFVGPMPEMMGPMPPGYMDELHRLGDEAKAWSDMTLGEAGQRIIGKGIAGFGRLTNSFRRGGQRLGSATEGAKGAGRSLWGMIEERYQKQKERAMDIYVNGMEKAKLTYYGLTNELYIDVNTGSIIRSIEDITGEVKDKAGNVILSADDFAKGLHTVDFKPILARLSDRFRSLANTAMRPVQGLRNAASRVGNFILDTLDQPEDLFVPPDMETPRLTARLFELGAYTLKETGEVITRLSQIKGAVMHGDKEVLSLDEVAKVVDREGKPIRSIKGIAKDLLKKGLKRGINLALKAGTYAKDKFMGAVDKLKGMSFNPLNWLKGAGEGIGDVNIVSRQTPVVERLDKIYALMEEKLECVCGKGNAKTMGRNKRRKLKGAGGGEGEASEAVEDKNVSDGTVGKGSALDADGDGDVDNSAKDQQERRAKAAAAGEEKGRWSKLTDAMKNGRSRIAEGAKGGIMGLLGMIPGVGRLAAGLTSVIGAVVKGGKFVFNLLSKAKNLFGGKWLEGAGKLGRTMLNVGRFAVSAGGSIARLAAGAVMGMSLGTAALVVGGGYAAFKAYQYFTREDAPLSRFRMAQYGFKMDEDKAQKIGALEDLCLKVVKVSKESPPELGTGVKIEQALSVFGVDFKNKADLDKWVNWFTYRFRPVFLSHVNALYNLLGKTDIRKADDMLSKAQKIAYIKKVHFAATGNQSPYNMMASPFPGEEEVEVDNDKVRSIYSDMLDEINDGADDAVNKDADKEGVKADKGIKDTMRDWWKSAKEGVGGAFSSISAGAATFAAKAGKAWDSVAAKGTDIAKTVGSDIATGASNVAKGVAGVGAGIASAVGGAYDTARNAVSSGIESVANTMKGDKKQNFESVRQAAAKAGDPHPSVVAAQWALESGWGKHQSGKFNFFGVKAHGNEPGTIRRTREVYNGKEVYINDKFRDYNSLEEGIAGRVDFINRNPRYRKAGYHDAKTPFEAATALRRAGYATDPNYAPMLAKIIAGAGISPDKPETVGAGMGLPPMAKPGTAPAAAPAAKGDSATVTTTVASKTPPAATPAVSPASAATPAVTATTTTPPKSTTPAPTDMMAVSSTNQQSQSANNAEAQRRKMAQDSLASSSEIVNILRESCKHQESSAQSLVEVVNSLKRMEKTLPELAKQRAAPPSEPAKQGNPSVAPAITAPKEPVSMSKRVY